MKIPLQRRDGTVVAFVLVDDVDAHHAQYVWRLSKRGRDRQGYARRRIGGPHVLLHRLLLGLERGDTRQCDHINGDTFDCRRSNLRVVSLIVNKQNRATSKNSTSGFRGVSWSPSRGNWEARAQVAGQRHFIGRFGDPIEAARRVAAYREASIPYNVERDVPM